MDFYNLLIYMYLFFILGRAKAFPTRPVVVATRLKVFNISPVSTDRHSHQGRWSRTSQEAIHQDDEKDYRE